MKRQTHTLGDLSIMVCVHELEGLLVLRLLPRELFPGELPVLVLVVCLEQLVNLLPAKQNIIL